MVDVVLRVDLSILGKGNNMRRICIISLLMIMIPVGFADVFEGATLDPEILSQIMIDPSTSQQEQSSFFDTYQPAEDNWLVEQIRYFEPGYGQTANSAPFINLAGYLDTDLSWEAGGQFTMLAYVTDIDSPVVSVEVYWDGQPTGLFLEDDGLHSDFGASDGLWGVSFPIEPFSLPEGEYLLELRALDATGRFSDLWPYLTVHPN